MKYFKWTIIFLGLAAALLLYRILFSDNIVPSESRQFINIPDDTEMKGVIALLSEKHILQNMHSFETAAWLKGYKQILPGHYVFNRSMTNREIVNMLQSGNQVPVKMVIYNIRTKEEFADLVGKTIELNPRTLYADLNDAAFCRQYGLDTNNILTRFITDSYEMKWNTGIDGFMKRMDDGYNNFWQGDRLAKAQAMGYTPTQITILASIVEKECVYDKELPVVAGVYLNRLRINMPLQADPTLVFARRDFDAHRVTGYHKEFDSPYNTYMYPGLPPGPVCIPKRKSIDAVLNADQNDYLYFCANPDMSGHSVFSRTLADQNKIAIEYRKKLNERNVK